MPMTYRFPPGAGHRAAAFLAGLILAVRAQAAAPAEAVDAGSALPASADLRFADFFAFPVGRAGLQITDTLRAADGQRVSITGYMVAQDEPQRGHFFLTPVPVVMSEHADGDADDLPPATVLVLMPAVDRELPLLPTRGLLRLTGRLQVGRHEMEDGRIVWVRLELEPRAAPGTTAAP